MKMTEKTIGRVGTRTLEFELARHLLAIIYKYVAVAVAVACFLSVFPLSLALYFHAVVAPPQLFFNSKLVQITVMPFFGFSLARSGFGRVAGHLVHNT